MQTGPNKIVNISPRYGDGLLCRGYIDGFCPSVVTTGYVYANITEGSYGWMLYILSEFQHVELLVSIVPQSESIIPHKIIHQLAGLCSQ